MWIPEWVGENPPQSPNVAKSWRKLLANLPDCALKLEAVDAIFRALKAFPQAFVEAFGNLPKDIRISKAKPKSLTESYQGTGSRGAEDSEKQRTGALRAVAMNGASAEWLGIARDVVARYGHLNLDTEGLIDHFYYHGKPKAETAKRADVITALNVAISETRAAQV